VTTVSPRCIPAAARDGARPTGLILAAGFLLVAGGVHAQAPAPAPNLSPEMMSRVEALEPALESYVNKGMAAFDVPGAAVGIVAGDRLVYEKGFGLRRRGGHAPVDAQTVFQIGSTTKAFLATVLAIAVDRGKLKWNDRVVDLDRSFMLKDPYVTREFRVHDLLAKRSSLPPYANDALSALGFDPAALMRSLRFVEPRTSFRSTFAYTNITHLFAGRIAINALGAPDWPTLARREIIEPLGMHDTSFTAEAIENAADHATGHRWTPNGSVEIPFDPIFPYEYGPAGDINSSLEDDPDHRVAGGFVDRDLRRARHREIAGGDQTTPGEHPVVDRDGQHRGERGLGRSASSSRAQPGDSAGSPHRC
jgi:CubicO group peptidase (beta-lactamase class C family)